MSKLTVQCFKGIDDAEPLKTYEASDYVAVSDTPQSHRVVLNPNHSDPKKQMQLHVKDGERSATDPLRFQRIEIFENVEEDEIDQEPQFIAGFSTDGRSFDAATEAQRSPTFEEYTEDGYRPASYPPRGHEIVSSAGYDAYLKNKTEIDAEWDKQRANKNASALNRKPVDSSLAPLTPVPNEVELKLQPMIDAGADDEEVSEAIDDMDYKTLEAELLSRKLDVPKKANDRRLALKDAVIK